MLEANAMAERNLERMWFGVQGSLVHMRSGRSSAALSHTLARLCRAPVLLSIIPSVDADLVVGMAVRA